MKSNSKKFLKWDKGCQKPVSSRRDKGDKLDHAQEEV